MVSLRNDFVFKLFVAAASASSLLGTAWAIAAALLPSAIMAAVTLALLLCESAWDMIPLLVLCCDGEAVDVDVLGVVLVLFRREAVVYTVTVIVVTTTMVLTMNLTSAFPTVLAATVASVVADYFTAVSGLLFEQP